MNTIICLKATVLRFLAVSTLGAHIQACRICQRHVREDKVIAGLIRSYASAEVHVEPSPHFLLKLRSAILARPREVDFWEAAVLAARGWLISFGALAAFSIALNTTSLEPTPTQREEVAPPATQALALPDSSTNILIASGEAPSPEVVLLTLVSEDK